MKTFCSERLKNIEINRNRERKENADRKILRTIHRQRKNGREKQETDRHT